MYQWNDNTKLEFSLLKILFIQIFHQLLSASQWCEPVTISGGPYIHWLWCVRDCRIITRAFVYVAIYTISLFSCFRCSFEVTYFCIQWPEVTPGQSYDAPDILRWFGLKCEWNVYSSIKLHQCMHKETNTVS